MATTNTKSLLEGAAERFIDDVPALAKLKIVVRVELRERGGPSVWRLELPSRSATRDPAADAVVEVSMDRSVFNQLAPSGHVADWVAAYTRGSVHTQGDPAVQQLIAKVVQMRLARTRK